MKTSKEEIEKRFSDWKAFSKRLKLYEDVLDDLRRQETAEATELREEILDSAVFDELRQTISFGPTYIIYKEDIEDPDYYLFNGQSISNLPSGNALLRAIPLIGSQVRIKFSRDPKSYGSLEALATDYGDYYYYIIPSDPHLLPIYETMCSELEIYKPTEELPSKENIELLIKREFDYILYTKDLQYKILSEKEYQTYYATDQS